MYIPPMPPGAVGLLIGLIIAMVGLILSKYYEKKDIEMTRNNKKIIDEELRKKADEDPKYPRSRTPVKKYSPDYFVDVNNPAHFERLPLRVYVYHRKARDLIKKIGVRVANEYAPVMEHKYILYIIIDYYGQTVEYNFRSGEFTNNKEAIEQIDLYNSLLDESKTDSERKDRKMKEEITQKYNKRKQKQEDISKLKEQLDECFDKCNSKYNSKYNNS